MSPLIRLITISAVIMLALGDSTMTLNSDAVAVTSSTKGTLVSIDAASATTGSWWFGYGQTVTSGASLVTYTTVKAAQGTTALGLMQVNCASQWSSSSSATNPATTAGAFVGKASTSGCPVDFATLYSTLPTGSTTTTTPTGVTNLGLKTGSVYTWQWTQSATNPNVAGYSETLTVTANTVSSSSATTLVQTGTFTQASVATSTTTNSITQYFVGGPSVDYGFYLTSTSTAEVCIQNPTQWNASPGDCSANILSMTVSAFVAVVALIFFN